MFFLVLYFHQALINVYFDKNIKDSRETEPLIIFLVELWMQETKNALNEAHMY